jgi:large subunit ribosomal protein L25
MEKVVLKAVKRDVIGKQVKALRRAGQLPAVIYGHHLEPMAIALNAHEAGLTLGKLTSSSLVTIVLDGQEYPSLVREKQRNYIKGNITHVDFLAISLTEKLTASIRIEFTGVSAAVKDFNAVFVHGIETLEVECLPTDLPERVTVDISLLAQIGQAIHVRDITLPDNVRVLDDPDIMVAIAAAPKVEAEVAPVVEVAAVAVEGAEPALSVERGKKEEEAAEEKKKK